MLKNKKIIVAIDGHSGSGKGTTAKMVSSALGYKYLDTGAIYRAITLFYLQKNISYESLGQITQLLNSIEIEFSVDAQGFTHVELNGENVQNLIRTEEISTNVYKYAQVAPIREYVRNIQKKIGESKGVVVEGRDIGSKIFPDAELKVFITAKIEVRAKRRFTELSKTDSTLRLEDVFENLEQRDLEDTKRKESPLVQTIDAKILDTTNLTIEQQVGIVTSWANQIINS